MHPQRENSYHFSVAAEIAGILRLRKSIRIRESACFAQDDKTMFG
jgi:hypothetical protein